MQPKQEPVLFTADRILLIIGALYMLSLFTN